MFDFSKPTLFSYVLIHLFYVFVVIRGWKKYTSDNCCVNDKSFIFCFLLYLVFAFDGGDFSHYFVYVTNDAYYAFEEVYSYIGHAVGNNYILFRLIVWGTAFFLFKKCILRFGLDEKRTLFFFFVLFIMIFDYARSSLSMAIYFYGLSLIIKPYLNKPLISQVLGVILIVSSIFFHRSMTITLLVTFIIYLPFNKYTIVMLTIGLLGVGSFLSSFVESFAGAELFNDDINEKIQEYYNQEYDDHFSNLEWIRRYIEYSTFFIPFIIITKKMYFEKCAIRLDQSFYKIYKLTFALLTIAVSTLIVPNMTFVLFYRFLYMTIIPITILFCNLEQTGIIKSKTYKRVLFLGILCKLFGFSKRVVGGSLS